MDAFDEKMKKMAQSEQLKPPIGFEERLGEKIQECSTPNRKKRVVAKGLAIVAAVVALTTVTAIAAPAILNMTGGSIGFFENAQNAAFREDQPTLEQFNSVVGASVSDAGVTLTIDNLALADNYITVFYTATSDVPLPIKKNQEPTNRWDVISQAPRLSFRVNGTVLESNSDQTEAYLENDKTIKVVQRLSITQTLPDFFDFEICADAIFRARGDWKLPLQIDKRVIQQNSKTCTPNLIARVTSGWQTPYSHEITIDRISISPFGGQISISEYVKDSHYFSQFALQDDKGLFLDVLDVGGKSSIDDTVKTTNLFEFIGADANAKSITLIPLGIGSDDDGSPRPTLVKSAIDKFPLRLKQSDVGEIVVDRITATDASVSVTYHSEGAVLDESYFVFFDSNGDEIGPYSFAERTYNRALGTHTTTLTSDKIIPGTAAKIKEIGLDSRTVVLKTDQAVTIPLQEKQ